MAAYAFACASLLAFSCCAALAYEEVSIVNLRRVPNVDGADTGNISFAFEVNPPIQYGGPLTYDVVLHWEEEVRSNTGSSDSYYYRSRDYNYRTCQEHGNLRRNGQTYQFSVSKFGLGSGPLYVSVSASFVCNDSSSSYYYYRYCSSSCLRWQFAGRSSFSRIDTVQGSLAAFEVDLTLWPEEDCYEFDTAKPIYKVESALLSVLKKNANTPPTSFGIYSSRYMCIHKNFVTMRGVILNYNKTLATSIRDILRTWLSEHSSVVIGDREVGIRAGLCGLALSSVNDPVCGIDYPTPASNVPPNTSENTASNPQSDTSSSLVMEVETLKISLVSVCFVSGGLIVVIAVLVIYIFYRQRKKKSQRTATVVHAFSNVDEEDESGNLVFRES